MMEYFKSKNGKAVLFFGFYLIFFIFLGVYFNNIKQDEYNADTEVIDLNDKEVTNNYNVSILTDINYSYSFEINDSGVLSTFNGTRDNIDYNDYEYKYFLDINNINQLIKKGKLIDQVENTFNYELASSNIAEILETDNIVGINHLSITINNNTIEKVFMDLSEYMNREFYITLNYQLGE